MAVNADLIADVRIIEPVEWVRSRGFCVRARCRAVEVLKAPDGAVEAGAELTFLMYDPDQGMDNTGRYRWWWEPGGRALVFLNRRGVARQAAAAVEPGECEWEVRRHGGAADGWGQLLGGLRRHDSWVLADGSACNEVAGVLAAVRRTLGAGSSRTAGRHDLTAFGPERLVVPVDAELERNARGWLNSVDREVRLDGLGALAHFKSAGNVAILTGLLSDEAGEEIFGGGRRPATIYRVRRRAYEVLRAWGVAVERPVCETPGDVYRPAGLSLIGVAVIAAAGAWAPRRRRWVIGCVLTLGVAGLWVRSCWVVDDFVFAWGGARWEVTSYLGAVQGVRVGQWERGGPVVRRAFAPADEAERAAWDVRTPPGDVRFERAGIVAGAGPMIGRPGGFVTVGYGWLLGLAGAGPSVAAVRRLARGARARWRRRRGLCAACGYDLRGAATGVCSECGREV